MAVLPLGVALAALASLAAEAEAEGVGVKEATTAEVQFILLATIQGAYNAPERAMAVALASQFTEITISHGALQANVTDLSSTPKT